MRKIYWAIAFLWLPFQTGAQDGVVWHNQGPASSTGSGQATVHIGGHMKFSNQGGSAEKPAMSIASSRIKLIGDLINDVERGASGGKLFVPLSGGIFEFCGTSPQAIKTTGTEIPGASLNDIPSKLSNFIDFPKLIINNNKHVTLDARLAAKTQDIDLVKGWLILDSDKAKAGMDGDATINAPRESVLAHLLVEGRIDYQNWTATDINERGFIQVNLLVPGEGTVNQRSIVGFGSPFQQIHSDYFMFNTLLEFKADSKIKGTITDPKFPLKAGKGYVVGIDLRGDNPDHYPPLENYPNIDFGQRATEGYSFNRPAFSLKAPQNHVFGAFDANEDAYKLEKLNITNVSVDLVEGYNYLSNPFTCPLDIEQLLTDNPQKNDWGVISRDWDKNPDVYNAVWLLGPKSMAEATSDVSRSKYTYSYLVAMNTGGTYTNDDADSYNIGEAEGNVTSIAPLQMFLVYSYKNMPITIPKSKRVMGTTRFLRNAPAKKQRADDFVIEFRDMGTKTSDRLSFVLRPQCELSDFSDVERLKSTNSEGSAMRQNYASQIFTRGTSGKDLTVQFLPLETTTRIQLYQIPPLEAQEIQIVGQRIQTRSNAQRMWLTDSKYPDIKAEITPDMIYETYSEPTDNEDRFAIVFSNEIETSIGIETTISAIYAYQTNSSIYVKGFNENDFGSIVSLYDMNGRLLTQKAVDSQRILLSEGNPSGVYLIKTGGEQSKVLKLIVR